MPVISLADSDYADYCFPRLSACRLPLYEAGRKAADILLETLEGYEIPVNLMLPCTLEARKS